MTSSWSGDSSAMFMRGNEDDPRPMALERRGRERRWASVSIAKLGFTVMRKAGISVECLKLPWRIEMRKIGVPENSFQFLRNFTFLNPKQNDVKFKRRSERRCIWDAFAYQAGWKRVEPGILTLIKVRRNPFDETSACALSNVLQATWVTMEKKSTTRSDDPTLRTSQGW